MPAQKGIKHRSDEEWARVRAWYVSTPDSTTQKAAKKFGIPVDTVRSRAKKENWGAAKKERQPEITKKSLTRAEEIITKRVISEQAQEIVTTELLCNETRKAALDALKEAQGTQKMWAASQAATVAKTTQQALAIAIPNLGDQAGPSVPIPIERYITDNPDRPGLLNFLEYAPHLKILTKTQGLQPFHPNAEQIKLWAAVEEQQKAGLPVRIVVVKFRQVGTTTGAGGIIYHDAATRSGRHAIAIAHKKEASGNLLAIYKRFHDHADREAQINNQKVNLQPLARYSSKKELILENPDKDTRSKNPGLMSGITIESAENEDAGRSGTYQLAHLSEVGIWPKHRERDREVFTSVMATVPSDPDTIVIAESTGKEPSGLFYDLVKDAEIGANDFKLVFFPWHENPDNALAFKDFDEKKVFIEEVNRPKVIDGKAGPSEEKRLHDELNLTWEQLHWRKWTIRNTCGGDVDKFKREYPATVDEAFLHRGASAFDQGAVAEGLLKASQTKPIRVCDLEILDTPGQKSRRFVDLDRGPIKIYGLPEKGAFYILVADVAEGGPDAEDKDNDRSAALVMEYRTGRVMAMFAGYWEPAIYAKYLIEVAKYYNGALIAVERNNHGHAVLATIRGEGYRNLYRHRDDKKYGWPTNPKTRPVMISDGQEVIRQGLTDCPDLEVWRELRAFQWSKAKNRYEAMPGHKDDLVIAWLMFWQVRKRIRLPRNR
ncbi:MAG: hypothetical protein KKC37_09230 [Proteobacteria bacterium]|nr:hypothetical protein [Pseudomonadota bacterium]